MNPDFVCGVELAIAKCQIGQQKVMEQTRKQYGSRISILGLWQAGENLEYGLVQGGFKGKSYIKVMDWIAKKAASNLQETGSNEI